MQITLTVNGRTNTLHVEELSYEDIVDLANTGRTAPYTVMWAGGGQEGILVPGQSMRVCNGMRITALITDNA